MPIGRGPNRGGRFDAFEGISEFRHDNDAQSLHEAIQQAAASAAKELNLEGDQVVDFELSRVQIVVGNPNVKGYRVEITRTDTP